MHKAIAGIILIQVLVVMPFHPNRKNGIAAVPGLFDGTVVVNPSQFSPNLCGSAGGFVFAEFYYFLQAYV
jgi:hypothetical protein